MCRRIAELDKEKAVLREGRQRGDEIARSFLESDNRFCIALVEEPEGDCALLAMSMHAMNEEYEFPDGERHGGSRHIGKMLFSACDDHLAIAVYVTQDGQKECSCEEWLEKILDLNPGCTMDWIGTDVRMMFVLTTGVHRIALMEELAPDPAVLLEELAPDPAVQRRRLTLVNAELAPGPAVRRRRLTLVNASGHQRPEEARPGSSGDMITEMSLGERLFYPDRRALRRNLSQRIADFVSMGEYVDCTNDTGLERLIRLWEEHGLLAELKRQPLTPRLGEAIATVARLVIRDGVITKATM
jgi:hypothetical protein